MRKFNTTGKILPEKHYCVDLDPQIDKLMELVEDGAYFVINRSRQFGKTTLLNFFTRHLLASKEYVPALISFQRFTQQFDIPESEFYNNTASLIAKPLHRLNGNIFDSEIRHSEINSRYKFFDWLGSICQHLPGKLVLLVDEIDTIPGTVVIGFLAGLREMFMDRDIEPAPHTVALVGVHDIRNLKARYRDATKTLSTDSPFNIAVTYELPPFSLENIRQYFSQHTEETGQVFDDKVIVRVHHVTNGHPWLTSVLAKFMVEEIVPDRTQRILPAHAEVAIQKLVNARNPNFESLFNHAAGQLVFLSYLDLLVNGKGWTFKEVRSGLGWIDVLCCYGDQKEVVEIKMWYGERRYEEGLEQLAGYLESEGLDHGYLLVFDRRGIKPKEYTCKEHITSGEKIQAWVV